jgi:hypothetical protein
MVTGPRGSVTPSRGRSSQVVGPWVDAPHAASNEATANTATQRTMIRVILHLLRLDREEPAGPSLPIVAHPCGALAVPEPHCRFASCTPCPGYTLSHDREAQSLLVWNEGTLISVLQSLPYSGPIGCRGLHTSQSQLQCWPRHEAQTPLNWRFLHLSERATVFPGAVAGSWLPRP